MNSMAVQPFPSITIGIVTHQRAQGLGHLLIHLVAEVEAYPCACELLIANNSGEPAHADVDQLVQNSGIHMHCKYCIIDSPVNSVSVGRNLILEHAAHPCVAFLDDDEYPQPGWLNALVNTLQTFECAAIAGPIQNHFPESASRWIKSFDLHNTYGLKTGDTIDIAGAGNLLLDMQKIGDLRFDPDYGNTGGEDSEFCLRITDRGHIIRWCAEAVVIEEIPANRARLSYLLPRFMMQGAVYRRIARQRGEEGNRLLFSLRAVVQCVVALMAGLILGLMRRDTSGVWIKKGFANLGKVVRLDRREYGGGQEKSDI